ncbi:MAG: sulfatase-like hydrolase/transferase, partial [Bacteroidales bacterium]
MNTEAILKYLAFLPGLGMMAGSCAKPESEKPNFLILISDDQRWDQLSCADHPIIPELRTPNLDRLAKQGSYFTNAFVTSPICTVSRASILTGRYAASHGMNHFNTPLDQEVLAKSYPALLRGNGYLTGILGKWGIGVEGTEQAFDVFNAWADQGRYFHDTDTGRIHNSEWLAAKARNFLESVDPAVPFCLTVCFKSPHHPYQPDERDKNLFEDVVIPM